MRGRPCCASLFPMRARAPARIPGSRARVSCFCFYSGSREGFCCVVGRRRREIVCCGRVVVRGCGNGLLMRRVRRGEVPTINRCMPLVVWWWRRCLLFIVAPRLVTPDPGLRCSMLIRLLARRFA